MMRKLFAIGVLCLPLLAQNSDPAMAMSGGPASRAWTRMYFYKAITAVDYVEYVCYAPVAQPSLTNRSAQGGTPYTVTQIVTTGSVATVTTSAAHGFQPDHQVTVGGVTGAGTGLNGSNKIATVPSSTTFTFASAVTSGTYNNSGITLTSSAARSNGVIWGIQRYYYGGTDGTSVVRTAWAVKSGSTSSSSSNVHSCDDRATLAYQ